MEALVQIKLKQNWLKYLGQDKEIRFIGVNFDTRIRRISGYLIDTAPVIGA